MAAYASLAEAKEAVGGHCRAILELTLLDLKGNRPTGAFWTTPRILHLCSGEAFLRDSTSTTGFILYESLVKSWGQIQQRINMNDAFGTISDTQIVLYNRRIAAQTDNSEYTFASGTPGMDPKARGDEVKLTELLQFYNLLTAKVEIKLFFFSEASLDQSVAANYQVQSIFGKGGTAYVNGFDISEDGTEITLDIVQDQTIQNTLLPNRVLSDATVADSKVLQAPIHYGNYNGYPFYAGGALGNDTGGLTFQEAVLARLYTPQVIQAIPWKRDPSASLGNADYLWYLYNNSRGRNLDWTYQTGFTGKSSGSDMALVWHPSANVWTKLNEGTAEGQIIYPNLPAVSTEQFVSSVKLLAGKLYVPCVSMHSAGTVVAGVDTQNDAQILNRENLFNGDPFTYAELPSDAKSYVMLRIKPISPLGECIPIKQGVTVNVVRAYIVLAGSTNNNATVVKYGIWRQVPNIPGGSGYIGAGAYNQHPALSTWGQFSPSGGAIGTVLRDQADDNTDNIPSYSFVRETGFEEALCRYEWKYSYAEGEVGDLLVRIEISTIGSGGEKLRIIAAGVIMEHLPEVVREGYDVLLTLNQVDTPFGVENVTPYKRWRHRTKLSRNPIPIWMSQRNTMLDNPVGAKAIQAVANAPIEDPAYIAAHLLLTFGEGTSGNITMTPGGSTAFGEAYAATTTYDNWLFIFGAGGYAPAAILDITDETRMQDALRQLCSQFPMMLYRDVGSGKVYFVGYPETPPLAGGGAYYQSVGTAGIGPVELHPNIFREDTEWYGKPYSLKKFRPRVTSLDEIYNRFRLKYNFCAATGEFTHEMVITESPNECRVYSTTSHRNNGTTFDLSATLGVDLAAVCATSQSRYGVKRQFPTIEAACINTHWMAMMMLLYLVRRYTHTRIIVRAGGGNEFCDLVPGKLLRYSRDCNLIQPFIDYNSQGAKKKGWDMDTDASPRPDVDFMVFSVNRIPHDMGADTEWESEQLKYNWEGSFWTPALDANCLECIRADDITGVADGGAIATWQKLVGQDYAQATANNKPTYRAKTGTGAINGRPCVDFDGVDDYMTLGGSVDSGAAGDYMMVVVAGPDTAATGTRPFASWHHDATNILDIFQNHATPNNVAALNGATIRDSGQDGTAAWQVLVFVFAGGLMKVYRNGTRIDTGAPAYTQVRLKNTLFAQVGSDNSGANFFDGKFSIYAVTKDVTDATRYKYEGMGAHWVGIESQLPADHLYRFSPAVVG